MFTYYKPNKPKEENTFNEVKNLLTGHITALLGSHEFTQALRRTGIISYEQYRETTERLKASLLQTLATSLNTEVQKISNQTHNFFNITESPVAKKLHEKDGFNLLLLTVTPSNGGSRKLIVGATGKETEEIFAKIQLTALDYEKYVIVRAFEENEEISEQTIQSSIQYFEECFIPNAKMRKFREHIGRLA